MQFCLYWKERQSAFTVVCITGAAGDNKKEICIERSYLKIYLRKFLKKSFVLLPFLSKLTLNRNFSVASDCFDCFFG